MKNIARLIVGCCAFWLIVQSASAQAPSRPFLTGKWQGVMTAVQAEADGSPHVMPPIEGPGQIGFRLDIRADNLVLYFQSGDQWAGIGEGLDLRTYEQGRSAITTVALPAGENLEVMQLNIVRYDEDTIGVFMTRVTGGAQPSAITMLGRLTRADF